MNLFSKFINELKLIYWLCGSGYIRTLTQGFAKAGTGDVQGVLKLSAEYFPFINAGYFKGFHELKQDAESVVGLNVQELPLPDRLLGAYLPEAEGRAGMIFINNRVKPVFWLSTLAHELSHAVVYRYYRKQGGSLKECALRHRLSQFQDDLQDKEEIMADMLTAIGTYTQPDLKTVFYAEANSKKRSVRFSFGDFWKAFKHLNRTYPEVTRGFMFTRDMLLNVALIVHFLRLRMFVFDHFEI